MKKVQGMNEEASKESIYTTCNEMYVQKSRQARGRGERRKPRYADEAFLVHTSKGISTGGHYVHKNPRDKGTP